MVPAAPHLQSRSSRRLSETWKKKTTASPRQKAGLLSLEPGEIATSDPSHEDEVEDEEEADAAAEDEAPAPESAAEALEEQR